ncbi:DUF397 domain-containing protein [Streptomyces sp. MP131-18]|uniref:DUF397 domain-containing protein n=1 Tax=Streptomyces sp. MP131-18 TaxID=1857892 RepID=UPI00097C7F37|nr:DUF397 domain-containing protein [Streptomyces sp. MP131-18]ONK12039.1 hypothetical protein STBA_27750 [Streptomyces sp. MP131-18]
MRSKSIPDVSQLSAWRKSSYSGGDGGSCLEVAGGVPGVVPVRDSKNRSGAVLVLPAGGWSGFVAAVRGGAFDG